MRALDIDFTPSDRVRAGRIGSGKGRRQEGSALENGDSGDPPSADCQVSDPADAGHVSLTSSEWKIVKKCADEAMAPGEGSIASVRFDIDIAQNISTVVG